MAWINRFTLALCAVAVIACSGASPAATIQASAAPVETPEPAETPDASRTAKLQDNILVVHGEKPRPDWYKYLVLVDKQPELAVFGTGAWIAAKPGITTALAKSMCRDIAVVAFDDAGNEIGFRHVHIELLRDPDTRIADTYLDLEVVASCNTRT